MEPEVRYRHTIMVSVIAEGKNKAEAEQYMKNYLKEAETKKVAPRMSRTVI